MEEVGKAGTTKQIWRLPGKKDLGGHDKWRRRGGHRLFSVPDSCGSQSHGVTCDALRTHISWRLPLCPDLVHPRTYPCPQDARKHGLCRNIPGRIKKAPLMKSLSSVQVRTDRASIPISIVPHNPGMARLSRLSSTIYSVRVPSRATLLGRPISSITIPRPPPNTTQSGDS